MAKSSDLRRLWDMLRDDGFAPDVPAQLVDEHTWAKFVKFVEQVERQAECEHGEGWRW